MPVWGGGHIPDSSQTLRFVPSLSYPTRKIKQFQREGRKERGRKSFIFYEVSWGMRVNKERDRKGTFKTF